MKLIIGLGNPGRQYQGTRHNIGFSTIDILARRHRIHVRSRRSKSLVGEGIIASEEVVLSKPLTFVNLSGQAVGGLVRRYKLDMKDVLVICDDVNLPLGRLRIRTSGSAGGHKGLKSVIHSLGTEDFVRIRIGIGSPAGHMVDHVLSRFQRNEREAVRHAIERAADSVETYLVSGIEQAMNQFNASETVD